VSELDNLQMDLTLAQETLRWLRGKKNAMKTRLRYCYLVDHDRVTRVRYDPTSASGSIGGYKALRVYQGRGGVENSWWQSSVDLFETRAAAEAELALRVLET